MSKAIQSIDVAIPASGAARNGASRRSEQDEPGVFSRLLSAGQAETADTDGAQLVPGSGNRLPGEQHQAPPGRAAERAPETSDAALDAVLTTDRRPPADAAPLEQPAVSAADLPAELLDAAHSGSDGQPASVPDNAPSAGQQAAEREPATAVTATVGVDSAQPEILINQAVADAVQDAMTVAGLPAWAAASALPARSVDPDNARSTAPVESGAHALREGVMQLLVAQAAPGNTGQSLANGRNEQPAPIEQSALTRTDAGVMSFTDALSETGTTTPSSRVPAPFGQPGWGRAVGEQVVWFVAQNIKSASLRLNPQHLGPLELQIHMDGDKASIAFASQHAVVRDALEASLPRLRDMLAEQGLNLVNVNVSQQDVAGRRGDTAHGDRSGTSAHAGVQDEQLPVPGGMPGVVTTHGLVDYYV